MKWIMDRMTRRSFIRTLACGIASAMLVLGTTFAEESNGATKPNAVLAEIEKK